MDLSISVTTLYNYCCHRYLCAWYVNLKHVLHAVDSPGARGAAISLHSTRDIYTSVRAAIVPDVADLNFA